VSVQIVSVPDAGRRPPLASEIKAWIDQILAVWEEEVHPVNPDL
jgi:hypothetical protein